MRFEPNLGAVNHRIPMILRAPGDRGHVAGDVSSEHLETNACTHTQTIKKIFTTCKKKSQTFAI
jgi:hypothetical protein